MSTPEENVQIWRDTVKKARANHYPYSESIIYDNLPPTPTPRYNNMSVSVVNDDTFSCCEGFVKKGFNVAGLNMANPTHAGGGVNHGAFAQEENCFRRSNYFMSLPQSLYPIPETGCIYTPVITVFKDKHYQMMKQPFIVSMVACAAIISPTLTPNEEYAIQSEQLLMKLKIGQIFQVAYHNKIETLVLGAFGCGAFGNPPVQVAHMFNEIIHVYNKCFKHIIFAVKSHNDPNFQIFSQIIGHN
jgi:uncharacterized protein (TIGR02452 family)